MCGIAGIYHPKDASDGWRSVVSRMTSLMVHRGPDDDGFYHASSVTLGMRRLSVIDLVAGKQPIRNETGTIQVVANGEIYRFERLRAQLEARGHAFRTKSDTEVLVHLYEEYDLDFLNHVDGMFALALWDVPRCRLVVARDRFGIKPLYYSVPGDHGQFAFASEIQALRTVPEMSMTLDPAGLDKFFALSYIPHPWTVYEQVRKLSPGCYLLAEEGRVECVRYWDIPAVGVPLPEEEAIAEVGSAIDDAVSAMMRADVPVGALLSGGLDSGTVVYHMARHSRRPIRTFSVRFREDEFDEGLEAKEIAESLGAEHTEVWCTPKDVMAVSALQAYFGEPFADPSQIPTYLIAKVAREQVTVALSGDAGDELFGGYPTYCASLLADRSPYLPESVRRGVLGALGHLPKSWGHAGLANKLEKFLRGCRLAPAERHAMWRTVFSQAERQSLYAKDFADLCQRVLESPLFPQWQELFFRDGGDPLKGYQFLDIKTYLTDNNLKKVDHMSMANSLEVRIPLLDLGVVHAAMRVPEKLLVSGLKTKTILRRVMSRDLPRSVLRMRKKGFTIPLAAWFRGPLKGYVDAVLSTERIRGSGILNPETVKGVVDAHMRGRRNNSQQIWNLIVFMHWYEHNDRH